MINCSRRSDAIPIGHETSQLRDSGDSFESADGGCAAFGGDAAENDYALPTVQTAGSSPSVLLYPLSNERVLSTDGRAMFKIAPVVTIPPASSSEKPPNPEFTSQAVVCLIEAVGRRWGLYGPRERAQLFQGVQQELEDHGYVLPVDRIRRKWNNLIVTYKRVKDRSCGMGQTKTSWEYFELMDAMLGDTIGTKASGTPSASMVNVCNGAQETSSTSLTTTIKSNLQSSSVILACSQVPTVTPASLPQSATPHPSSTAPSCADPQSPSPSRGSPPDRHDRLHTRRKLRHAPADVAASFLLQQQRQTEDYSTMLCDFLAGQEDRARLQEMRLVRHESRERRRERREGKMADALCRIATALELLSSKQDTVIALLQRLADK